MEGREKRFLVEIFEEEITYYTFEDNDFKNAEKLAEEFVRKGTMYSGTIYYEDNIIEMINWDNNTDQVVFVLTSYGKYKGFEIIKTK